MHMCLSREEGSGEMHSPHLHLFLPSHSVLMYGHVHVCKLLYNVQ